MQRELLSLSQYGAGEINSRQRHGESSSPPLPYQHRNHTTSYILSNSHQQGKQIIFQQQNIPVSSIQWKDLKCLSPTWLLYTIKTQYPAHDWTILHLYCINQCKITPTTITGNVHVMTMINETEYWAQNSKMHCCCTISLKFPFDWLWIRYNFLLCA